NASSISRRPKFRAKLLDLTDTLYKFVCGQNTQLWSASELAKLKEDLAELDRLAVEEHEEREDREAKLSEGSGDTFVRSSPPPPDHSDVTKAFRARLTIWRDEIAPDLAKSHPDMVAMVAEHGKFDTAHVSALYKMMDEFLDDSLIKVKGQARFLFDERIADLRMSVDTLQPTTNAADVEVLAGQAQAAAHEATALVRLAVGNNKAAVV
ncbi:unnamed protein product, partial [Laminaria digitata]